ncbi:MAG: pepsin/retropepsin-like aspartic protease family protein [Ferruginibacter sp.]
MFLIGYLIRCTTVLLALSLAPAAYRYHSFSTPQPKKNQNSIKKISLDLFTQPNDNDSLSCVIPFSRAGNLILLKAKADTTEGNFILDTGAPGLILNLTYFRNYPAIASSDDSQGGITGNVAVSSHTMINKFSFGAINYSHVEADRINLGHIENNKGIKVLGLLGMQLFRQFEMIIDYEQSLIYLHRIGKKEAAVYKSELLKDTSGYSVLPIELKENKILVFAVLAGKKLTLLIDSGAESNVLDSRLPNKVFESVSITKRVLLNGTGAKKVEALYGDARNMKIGKESLDSLPVLITNLEKMCFSYDYCLDGILGFDFMSLHKIGFNFVNRKMYIWK